VRIPQCSEEFNDDWRNSHEFRYTNMPQLQCIVVTPEATIRDQPADFVALPLYDGEIGIAPGHSPMIGRLGYGEMRIREGGQTLHYYVDGGFVEVLNDVVSVLTNRAVPAEKLDADVAAEQLATARIRPSHTPELMAIRDRLVTQSRAQLRVARKR
jgi:F-type H+-transporting ATPase subunit epsilon